MQELAFDGFNETLCESRLPKRSTFADESLNRHNASVLLHLALSHWEKCTRILLNRCLQSLVLRCDYIYIAFHIQPKQTAIALHEAKKKNYFIAFLLIVFHIV